MWVGQSTRLLRHRTAVALLAAAVSMLRRNIAHYRSECPIYSFDDLFLVAAIGP
jgi:hypothetical protein